MHPSGFLNVLENTEFGNRIFFPLAGVLTCLIIFRLKSLAVNLYLETVRHGEVTDFGGVFFRPIVAVDTEVTGIFVVVLRDQVYILIEFKPLLQFAQGTVGRGPLDAARPVGQGFDTAHGDGLVVLRLEGLKFLGRINILRKVNLGPSRCRFRIIHASPEITSGVRGIPGRRHFRVGILRLADHHLGVVQTLNRKVVGGGLLVPQRLVSSIGYLFNVWNNVVMEVSLQQSCCFILQTVIKKGQVD